mmetsp:Transcript_1783/g.3320  ORF Transcript_1783/g.3320 Transcript_1783/m.3320 type:complete len:281 (+) Transcript_1783:113-955(+)
MVPVLVEIISIQSSEDEAADASGASDERSFLLFVDAACAASWDFRFLACSDKSSSAPSPDSSAAAPASQDSCWNSSSSLQASSTSGPPATSGSSSSQGSSSASEPASTTSRPASTTSSALSSQTSSSSTSATSSAGAKMFSSSSLVMPLCKSDTSTRHRFSGSTLADSVSRDSTTHACFASDAEPKERSTLELSTSSDPSQCVSMLSSTIAAFRDRLLFFLACSCSHLPLAIRNEFTSSSFHLPMPFSLPLPLPLPLPLLSSRETSAATSSMKWFMLSAS